MNLHPYSFREISHPYERHMLGGLSSTDSAFKHIQLGDTYIFRGPTPLRPAFEFRSVPMHTPVTLPMFSSGPQFLRGPGDRI